MRFRRVKCGCCDGKGYDMEEVKTNLLEFTDCQNCKGKGMITIEISDKRQNSLKKELHLPHQW